MKRMPLGIALILCVCLASLAAAQQGALTPPAIAPASAAVPNLINYTGILKDSTGRTLTGITGVSFLLYKDEQGGSPLWLETQNVTPDKLGHYTVQLGTSSAHGVPADLFVTGEARWLAVQVGTEAEQPRVLLVAVPYAMKAGDAATIGGLPPSAFVLAAPGVAATTGSAGEPVGAAPPPASSNVTTTGGTINTLPLFTTATNIQNSAITQTGSGATAKVGINTTAPNANLFVNGTAAVNGIFTLPSTGTATAAGGKNSQPQDFIASVFNSGTSTAVPQKFQWQAEPVGNNTAGASGTMNLLYASGTAAPAETGLKISSKGVFTFAAGQTFPGTGPGTVKSVGLTAPATDFSVSGSPVTGTGTLNFAWKVAPTNADTANAIVKRDATGNFSAGTITAVGLAASGSITGTDGSFSDGLSVTSTAEFPFSVVSNNTAASVVLGQASSTTGDAWGVEGLTASSAGSAYGVIGQAQATSGTPVGVYGLTASTLGVGVFGQNGTESSTGSAMSGSFASGVWGDGGQATGEFGVTGTVDDGIAGFFVNNSSGGHESFWVQAENTASLPFIAGFGASTGVLTKFCDVDSGGNLNCTGAKNAVVPVDAGKRTIALAAIESPKNWFEDFGSAQLVHGSATVPLDADFMQTVNTSQEYQVFLTPYGDCRGLYVSNRTANSFEVHELGGGTGSLSFGYRITALRKNFENVRFADHTHDLDGQKLMQQRIKKLDAKPQSHDPVKSARHSASKTALLTRPVSVSK